MENVVELVSWIGNLQKQREENSVEEIISHLTLMSILENSDDVHLLTPAELTATCTGTSTVGPEVLRRRRRWLDRYENEGVLPLRFSGRPDRAAVPVPDGDQLHGWGEPECIRPTPGITLGFK